jgi:acetyl-CoA carboxylase carboxyl transferase subunit alpha
MDDILTLEFEKPIAELEKKIESLKASVHDAVDLSPEIRDLEEKCAQLNTDIYGSLSTWQRVQLARHPRRPYTLDYVKLIFTDFVELHGDRLFADDRALICGLAKLDGVPVAVIGHQKGRNLHDNIERNFGMAHPEGYRKALRVMKLAEKFNRPIITFIDTTGAYPGIGAEERGQAEAIARNLRDMAALRTAVVSIVIAEGGSGGALGIGVANRVLMLENAYYSVISPEGCAAILFRDAAKAQDAAVALKITAQDLLNQGVIDGIVKEPLGGAHRDYAATARNVKEAILQHLADLEKLSPAALEQDRYEKFRRMGVFAAPAPAARHPGKAAKRGRKKAE